MSSRTCVTGAPDSTVLSTGASACELMPRRRASSWSTRRRNSRDGSIQSKLTCVAFGLAATAWASFMAMARTSAMSGSADAILHRPADRRPELERVDAGDEAGNSFARSASSFFCRRSRAGDVLGDDHDLAEEVVGKLRVERQIEPDRAAADIGAPALDVGIVLQRRVEARRRSSWLA